MATSTDYLPAISSMSLGRAWHHNIAPKLAACGRHGFKAIELFYEDLEYAARSLPQSYPAQPPNTSFPGSTQWDEQQVAAASYIRYLCRINKLKVLCLQPFMHYEGLLDRSEHNRRIRKLKLWFLLAKILGTDLIQIPSNFLPASQCTSDLSVIVEDFREVADLGLRQTPPIRFAYEALCWGTHIDTWDAAYKIVQAVDRPNFGTCLDTFNLAGRVYADPAHPSGRTPHADIDMGISLSKLRTIDIAKVFYVEVVDAERLSTPLVAGHPWHRPEQKPRMSWSRNARLFPFERNAYLPILDVLKVITQELGYTGYISFELFSRSMNEKGPNVPEEHARRGQRSWAKLQQYMGWEGTASGEAVQLPLQLHGIDSEEREGDRQREPAATCVRRRSSRGQTGSDAATQIQLAPSKL